MFVGTECASLHNDAGLAKTKICAILGIEFHPMLTRQDDRQIA